MEKYIKECSNGGFSQKHSIEEHKEKLFKKKRGWENGEKRDHSGNVNHGIILNYTKKSNWWNQNWIFLK